MASGAKIFRELRQFDIFNDFVQKKLSDIMTISFEMAM